jgi:TBC1 domain family member 10
MTHFEEIMYEPSMNTMQWFTCLFCYNFNFEVVSRLWDVYFLKGDRILFRISLAIFHLLERKLLKCQSIPDV